ncbi:MAG: carboxypeptidase regulatory-like domain-containing protein [Bacteroidales bacterium]|nr:carboxypeptidase regulatory-like domain-containing protein [Bacteroidales bacterium]
MKRILFLLMFLIAAIAIQAQNAKVSGRVFDSESGKVIKDAVIQIGNQTLMTNDEGYFESNNIPVGKANITISLEGYNTSISEVEINAPETNFGVFNLELTPINIDRAGISEVYLSTLDFDDDNKGQNIPALLHSTSDAFTNTASFTLGAAYFRVRGYDSENSLVYMSGIPVNDPETGRPAWSEWGGLNDAMRNKDVVNGLNASRFSFGSVGGATNIITRASLQRKQTKISYALSNKSYTNRVMLTYSTGLMENNWAFTVSGSRRWGNTSYVDGIFYDAWAYFGSAEKKINQKHSVALTVYGSPTKRGMQAASTQEAYDLLGTNYYNPNWGYQAGEKRNAKVKNFHEPMFILNHYWNFNDKMKLTNSIAYSWGRNGTSNLNWYNAPDPRPDYYRYLPSYALLDTLLDPSVAQAIANNWKNDPNTSQINWDHLYDVNRLANLSGAQANYIIEERRNDQSQISFNSLFNYKKNEHLMVTAGLELGKYTGKHFKTILDMLGGEYWTDIDQYAIQDFPTNADAMQNDLNNPDRKVGVGDTYGYNYNTYENTGLLWGQAEFTYNKIEFFAAANVGFTQFWREGLYKNGRDPENSFGNSDKKNFTNYGVKGGATYKINGHNYVVGNVGYMTRAPFVKNAFVLPTIKNTYVPDLKSESILSGDISYIYNTQNVKVRLSAYHTKFQDGSRIITYYHDDYRTFVNMTMTGIDKVMQGFELGADIKVTSTISVIAVGALGNYRYTSRPTATVSLENQAKPDITETIYQNNFYLSGTPQNAASLGVKYAHPKYWFFNANVNYFDKMWLDFNPERRTENAITGMGYGDPLISAITKQQQLDGGFTLDASIGKSILYKKHYININFSMSNILNNQNLITNGYEQMRYDYVDNNLNKFSPKYFYMLGRTFYLTASIRF